MVRSATWSLAVLVMAGACKGDACDPDPCADDPASVCVDGECLAPELDISYADGGASGTFADPVAGWTATFSTLPDGSGGATATVTVDGASVDVTLVDGETVMFTLGSVALDGDGALSDTEQTALTAFATSTLAEVIPRLALDVGCVDNSEVTPEAIAALLAPWQLVLKYDDADRLATAQEVANGAACAYLSLANDPRPTPQGLLLLNNENPVPVVYGILPFDAEGAVEQNLRASGDAFGPCSALCRGACGGDCNANNCVTENGVACETGPAGFNTGDASPTLEITCGTADGCQAHDDCYDLCNSEKGCGTWSAALCRRECDVWAFGEWPTQGPRWAVGYGTHTSQLEFQYDTSGPLIEDAEECPLDPGAPQFQDPPSSSKMTWSDASAYCSDLSDDGFDDWYLPSTSQLRLLVQGCEPICDVDSCNGCTVGGGPGEGGCYWSAELTGTCEVYWTSTTFEYSSTYAWAHIFSTGGADIPNKMGEYYARCVRDGL